MANEMKFLKLDTVRLSVTEIHPGASRHSALSQGHIVKLEHACNAKLKRCWTWRSKPTVPMLLTR